MDATGERIRLEARRHSVVLVAPFARSLALTAVATTLLVAGWPLLVGAPPLLALAAGIAMRAVWRWDRTRVVVTTEKLFVIEGTLRRRASAVRLDRVGEVEVDEPLLGRLLGYGTVVAGRLEIPYVVRPHEVIRLLG